MVVLIPSSFATLTIESSIVLMNGIELDSGMMKIVLPRAFDASIGGPGCTNFGIALKLLTRFATSAGTAAVAATARAAQAAAPLTTTATRGIDCARHMRF